MNKIYRTPSKIRVTILRHVFGLKYSAVAEIRHRRAKVFQIVPMNEKSQIQSLPGSSQDAESKTTDGGVPDTVLRKLDKESRQNEFKIHCLIVNVGLFRRKPAQGVAFSLTLARGCWRIQPNHGQGEKL